MEKSIEKIWDEAFIKEDTLITPKINNLYNQKSKLIINKIKRTYELDNKGLLPMAGIVTIGGILLSETIIGLYGTFLILCLYIFNSRLLKRFHTIDVKSDNLTYLKEYKNVMYSIMKATKKLFMFGIPVAITSIFALSFFIKENSFLSRFISDDAIFIEVLGIGFVIALFVSLISTLVYLLSTKIMYGVYVSKLNTIIKEMEELKA